MCLFYLVSNCLAEHGILVQKFLSFRFPSMTPIFRGWGPGTCPLILLSPLSYFMPFHLFAFPLHSGGFGELYRVMILWSFFFFFYHILISESSFMYSECWVFFSFLLNWLVSLHSCTISSYHWDIWSTFIFMFYFLPSWPCFLQAIFSLFVSLLFFFKWEGCAFLIELHCNLDS